MITSYTACCSVQLRYGRCIVEVQPSSESRLVHPHRNSPPVSAGATQQHEKEGQWGNALAHWFGNYNVKRAREARPTINRGCHWPLLRANGEAAGIAKQNGGRLIQALRAAQHALHANVRRQAVQLSTVHCRESEYWAFDHWRVNRIFCDLINCSSSNKVGNTKYIMNVLFAIICALIRL